MRFVPFVLLLFTSFALSGCYSLRWRLDQAPKQTILEADRVELPTTFIQGVPYVDLQINGKGPYRFMVDTGSVGMSVSTRVAREAGILFSLKDTIKLNGSTGRSERFPVAKVDRVDWAHFSLVGVEVCVMSSEIEAVLAKQGVMNFGGMIGLLAFKNVLLEIDYPGQKVSVARLGSATPAPEDGIPFTGRIPFVTIATPSAKHPTNTAVIDTGAADGISLNGIAGYPMRVGLTKDDQYTFGIGGYRRKLYGQLAGDIRLGPVIWRDPVICDSAVANLIGGHALASWKLIIDQKRNMLWLVGGEKIRTLTWVSPLELDGRPAVYGFAGIPDGEAFIVKEVDPSSRAERAGMKVGDRFTFELPDSSLPVEGAGIHPTRIRLHIVRGDEKLEIVLSLLDQVPINIKSGTVPKTAE